jgi:hypothetical protein
LGFFVTASMMENRRSFRADFDRQDQTVRPQIVTFGPAIERVLPFNRSAIDFQTGEVLSAQDLTKLQSAKALGDWIKQRGADAIVEEAGEQRFVHPLPGDDGFPRLVSVGDRGESCVFVREESSDFDAVLPTDADARLKVVTERDLSWNLASGSRPWWFQTLDGAKGVLQILGTTDAPRGVKIRYKLVEQSDRSAPVKEPSPGQTLPFTTPTFGPVIERKITSNGGGLKLATGELAPLPDLVDSRDRPHAAGNLYWHPTMSRFEALTVVDLSLLVVGEAAWTNLSAAAVLEKQAGDAVAGKIDLESSEQFVGPGVYAFKGYGIAGLLQVIRPNHKTKDTPGMKIRYKLVQDGAHNSVRKSNEGSRQ